MLKPEIKELLMDGTVIPAHPLALDKNRKLDEKSQRRLTNYYIDAGAGGVAVGVHTTQFEIRDPEFNLYEKVLRMAAEEVQNRELQKPFIKVAGICGGMEQAKEEAAMAKELGYDLGLLSPGGLSHFSEDEMLERTKKVSEILPVFGFYLQPSVGGRVFSYDFWCEFANIPNVYAIKMAPFNRYQTLDVIRAVCQSKRRDEIALYTGNDDNIVQDLLTSYEMAVDGERVRKSIVGGLLGHWAVWTKKAVELFDEIKSVRDGEVIPAYLMRRNQEITDANAAFFDAANGFKGCIAGINEVLARQGILQGNWCLLEHEKLSPGQSAEIDRVYRDYPHLSDDSFVKQLSNY
ncbi:dihydrodipicolinate synthase family protein [Fictibacillus terranigra]|uniref:Dihydrodipicolinate synthase family protein n=1 Tax=Fictibacillus terranigra TaxID=3058424 RepID=A0ABT8E1C9_9BACL|nr:dihydrodipicolinate synthase family protein [Fictibacillus sp. CENA-BCM004]MDN4071698.1 dihydrodipicolinate synthase family protein [Fictibacillus sp. CENA-BCM004]